MIPLPFPAEFCYSQMSSPNAQTRTTFLSLPPEIRHQILLNVFSVEERGVLMSELTRFQTPLKACPSEEAARDFWIVQEQGWLVTSFCSSWFPDPSRTLQKRLNLEIAIRQKSLKRVHPIVSKDMHYVSRCWSLWLGSAFMKFCEDFKLQHVQTKGAGPGVHNWWWIPRNKEKDWYQSLQAQSAMT